MSRTTTLLPALALFGLGIAAPAMAGDIDEVAPAMLSSMVSDSHIGPDRDASDTARHRSGGTRTTKRTTTRAKGTAKGAARPASATQTRTQGVRTTTTTRTTQTRSAAPSRTTTVHATPRPAPRPGPGTPSRTVVTVSSTPGRVTTHATRVPARPAPSHAVPVRTGARPVAHGHTVHTVRRPVAVRTVTYRRVHPYHGVFVYGPRPVTHVHYHTSSGPVKVAQKDLPERAIDRENALAIGLKGGSMISSTPDGQVYGDPGLGLVGRYRPAESVALEMAVQRHGAAFGPELARTNTQVAGSVELFAYPWTRVSPYALAGVTWNAANIGSEVWTGTGYESVQSVDSQWGLHGGLGVEFALGNNFAFDLEGRYIGWLDERAVGEAPGALQATAGLMFHFK